MYHLVANNGNATAKMLYLMNVIPCPFKYVIDRSVQSLDGCRNLMSAILKFILTLVIVFTPLPVQDGSTSTLV